MEYRVVGIRRNMEFDTKDGGKMSGAKVYMTCKDDRVDGCMTDSFFVNIQVDRNIRLPAMCVRHSLPPTVLKVTHNHAKSNYSC